ncbi:NLRC3 [Symbiodinium necroappetens]|uniref:NLRC3 protein n=1 Tax=Symbiodinium necroappetens TaxID=1628268 RepID=A0A812Z4U9_9DINO|nr:NLRC3 [Symbiodinium necroappetens]
MQRAAAHDGEFLAEKLVKQLLGLGSNPRVDAALVRDLRPFLQGLPVHLAETAALIETRQPPQESARESLSQLSEDLQSLQAKLGEAAKAPEDAEAAAARSCLEELQSRLEAISEASDDDALAMLTEAKELLEGSASLMLVNRMGSFEHFESSLSEPLHELWDFASDHPPVGARIVLKGSGFGALNVASFNVLNMHYMKYIDNDWQGLKGSKMQQSPAEQRAEELVSVILRILHHPSHPKAVLCLQECWSEFLNLLEAKLGAQGCRIRCTGDRSQKNQEAIVYNSAYVELVDFHCLQEPYSSDLKKVIAVACFKLQGGGEASNGQLRIVTTHLPGTPYSPACRDFSDALSSEIKADCGKIPTLLMGDLNFPLEVLRPLLKHFGRLRDVHFAAIPYPTNVSQASLIPKRIDCIASLSPSDVLEVAALGADEVLHGLQPQVDLLRFRSAALLSVSAHDGVVYVIRVKPTSPMC